MSDDLRALYQAAIVDHDRNPRNAGPLPGATHEATLDNPLCGDVVTIRLIVDHERVRACAFEARGCALSRAAASMMTTHLVGQPLAALRALAAEFEAFARAAPDSTVPSRLGDLSVFVGVRAFKSRQLCAVLPFRALTEALARAT